MTRSGAKPAETVDALLETSSLPVMLTFRRVTDLGELGRRYVFEGTVELYCVATGLIAVHHRPFGWRSTYVALTTKTLKPGNSVTVSIEFDFEIPFDEAPFGPVPA